MKISSPAIGLSAFRPRRGFTLIEMLVVIGIIAILAGMIIPLSGLIARKRILARTRIEVDYLDLAINTYKLKKGFFPPDNSTAPAGAFTNQLFYELWGAVANPPLKLFTNTFNANETITTNLLGQFFGVSGIVNSSADPSDIINFVPTLKAAQIQNINPDTTHPVWVFAAASPGPVGLGTPVPTIVGQAINTIRYVSSNPTNNQSTFDLWVDVLIAGKTNRISNWSKDPEIVGP